MKDSHLKRSGVGNNGAGERSGINTCCVARVAGKLSANGAEDFLNRNRKNAFLPVLLACIQATTGARGAVIKDQVAVSSREPLAGAMSSGVDTDAGRANRCCEM